MVELTTGIIDNAPICGVRETTTFIVKVSNDDLVEAIIGIIGYYISGENKIIYVLELFSLAAGDVTDRNYYADLNAFEFLFTISSYAVKISAWGKDNEGKLVAAHRVLPAELDPLSLEAGATGATGAIGETGATGAIGATGANGSNGNNRGDRGNRGDGFDFHRGKFFCFPVRS